MQAETQAAMGSVTQEEIAQWLRESKDRDRLALILYQRYCLPKAVQYRYIGRELQIVGASKVQHLERTALQRLRQPPGLGRVEAAGTRVPQALWVALFGAWKPQNGRRA